MNRARDQHAAYERALRDLGCQVIALPEAPDLADAVFVEDMAIVLDELAVMTMPGVASRRPELELVETALRRYRPVVRIAAPGTLEGGDVLRLGHTIYVGVSSRTNADGVRQLQDLVAPHGYRVESVPVRGCLHLKSAVTELAPDLVLVNPEWVDPGAFGDHRFVAVAPGEPHAANALRIGSSVIFPAAFPATRIDDRTTGNRRDRRRCLGNPESGRGGHLLQPDPVRAGCLMPSRISSWRTPCPPQHEGRGHRDISNACAGRGRRTVSIPAAL